MTLAQLQIFLTLVQTGSFTKTGEVLGMSQSAVSHAVASLESEFGIPLLVRERRNSLTLSSAGERLIVHVREIIRRVGLMTEEIASIKGIESGSIRVGSCSASVLQMAPRLLAAFRQQHPDVEVVFVEGTTRDVLKWISIREVDVGLVMSEEPPENAVTLFTDTMVALLPCSFPCADIDKISMQSLRSEPLILTKSVFGLLNRDVFGEQGIKLRTTYEVSDIFAATTMVHEGLGFTVVPKTLVSTASMSKVQVRLLEPSISVTLSLVTPPFDEVAPAVRAFIEIAHAGTKQGGNEGWLKGLFAS